MSCDECSFLIIRNWLIFLIFISLITFTNIYQYSYDVYFFLFFSIKFLVYLIVICKSVSENVVYFFWHAFSTFGSNWYMLFIAPLVFDNVWVIKLLISCFYESVQHFHIMNSDSILLNPSYFIFIYFHITNSNTLFMASFNFFYLSFN